MPRQSHLIPPHKIKLSIPSDLYQEVSARLHSPRLRGREYGALSALVCTLLREWVARQPASNATMEHRTNEQLGDL